MATYTDRNQNEWPVEVVTSTIEKVRKRVKDTEDKPVDLLECVTGTLTGRLLNDPVLLTKVIWVIIEDYAKTKGLTYDQFAAAHRGEVFDKAFDALMAALADFFPLKTGEALIQITLKVRQMREKAMEAIVRTMDNAIGQIKPASPMEILSAAAEVLSTEPGN